MAISVDFSKQNKELFIKKYLELIEDWKSKFKPTSKEKFFSLFQNMLKKIIFDKNFLESLKERIECRKKLKKYTKSKAEMEILDVWTELDNIIIKDHPILLKIMELRKEYDFLLNKIKTDRKFEDAEELFKMQLKLLDYSKIFNKDTEKKVELQEKLRDLTKEYDRHENKDPQVILMGILTDLLSKNEQMTGIKVAISYTFLKNSRADIRNAILFTNQLKEKVFRDKKRFEILEKDIIKLKNSTIK